MKDKTVVESIEVGYDADLTGRKLLKPKSLQPEAKNLEETEE